MTDNYMMMAIDRQIRHCENILADKFGDYGNHADPFWHFNRAAALFSKHLTCIVEMAKDPGASVYLRWQEKLTDAINYLLILSSMIQAKYDTPADVLAKIARGE